MNEGNDSILVNRCLTGSSKAFEELVEKYQRPVYNVAFRMTRCEEDSEDIVQSVFLKVYENLESFNPKYKFFSWLYRIAINESLNFIKRKKLIEIRETETCSPDMNPEEAYSDIDLANHIQDALLEIPLEYRGLIVLKHFQNCSYREIAYIVDIPEKKVKSRLFSARHLLKDLLIRKGILGYD